VISIIRFGSSPRRVFPEDPSVLRALSVEIVSAVSRQPLRALRERRGGNLNAEGAKTAESSSFFLEDLSVLRALGVEIRLRGLSSPPRGMRAEEAEAAEAD